MWWIVPALWRPRCSGGGSQAIQPPRRSPRSSIGLRRPVTFVPGAPHGAHQPLEDERAVVGPEAVRAHALEALQRERGRDLRMVGDERLVTRGVHDKLMRQPLGVGEDQRVVALAALGRHAVVPESGRPEVDRLGRRHAPHDAVHHARARAARHRAGVLEEREVGARLGVLVAVEQVVDGRIVLVDGLGGHAQAEDACVEVDVARRVAGDGGDVVDAVEVHGQSFALPERHYTKVVAPATTLRWRLSQRRRVSACASPPARCRHRVAPARPPPPSPRRSPARSRSPRRSRP